MSIFFDRERKARIGIPECVFCEGKSAETLDHFLEGIARKKPHPVFFTRLSAGKFKQLRKNLSKNMDYDAESQTATFGGTLPKVPGRSVSVVTAGTSDLFAAREACRTLAYLGVDHELFADIGVAGLWRLERYFARINAADVVIAAAGMDGAIVSVLGGLTPKPVIALPTSVGYGVSQGGYSALHSMLSSCAPGILVVNIDNGYGAACAAYRMLRRPDKGA